jgi:hypothetical protein
MTPAACDTFNDIEDPELCMAFLHSIIAYTKQENPMMQLLLPRACPFVRL